MAEPDARTSRMTRFAATLHPWGVVAATLAFIVALSPSLLPRDWFYQGVVSGVAAGLTYPLGFVAQWLWHTLPGSWRASPRTRWIVERVAPVIAVLWIIGFVIAARGWQNDLAALTGAPLPSLWGSLLIVPTGLAFFLLIIGAGRIIGWLARRIARRLPGSWQDTVRASVAWVLVLIVGAWVVEKALPGTLVAGAERAFAVVNTVPDAPAPEQPQRSGSPQSRIAHENTGKQGARFLAQGLDAAGLAQATGSPAQEPIRIYPGALAAPTDRERAELAIAELERTGAAEREAMLLVMTTGTGWVNLHAAQAFEMLYGGDTAIVAEQYSNIPSAYHFFTDGHDVATAGRDFLGPIIDWWNTLDPETRPELYLYGESLGTTGVETAFSGMRDIIASVDGILLAGPPNFNPLHTELTEARDPDSREVLPRLSEVTAVRFADDRDMIRTWYGDGAAPDWGPTRVLYIQNASDPVVWWSPQLLFQEPEWLKEEAGRDRLPQMRWFPIITFLQVAADLPVSQNAPQGSGHNYGADLLDGFAAIAGPDRFTPEQVGGLYAPYAAATTAEPIR